MNRAPELVRGAYTGGALPAVRAGARRGTGVRGDSFAGLLLLDCAPPADGERRRFRVAASTARGNARSIMPQNFSLTRARHSSVTRCSAGCVARNVRSRVHRCILVRGQQPDCEKALPLPCGIALGSRARAELRNDFRDNGVCSRVILALASRKFCDRALRNVAGTSFFFFFSLRRWRLRFDWPCRQKISGDSFSQIIIPFELLHVLERYVTPPSLSSLNSVSSAALLSSYFNRVTQTGCELFTPPPPRIRGPHHALVHVQPTQRSMETQLAAISLDARATGGRVRLL